MAIAVGGNPSIRLTLNGTVLDHKKMGLEECSSSWSDDEASLCTLKFGGEGAVRSALFAHGAKLKLEYGWNGEFFADSWQGTLETKDPKFGEREWVTLYFYGSSFALRDGNAPETVKGTRKQAAERIIRKFGLKPDIHVTGPNSIISIKDTSSAWDALQAIARASGGVVRESGFDGVYVGPRDAQDYLLEFWYKDSPEGLTPTLIDYEAHWTRKKRLKKVTVVSQSARSRERFEGIWEYVPRRERIITKKGKVSKKTRVIKDEDPRENEITVYLEGLKSLTEAKARAAAIGARGESLSRQSTMIVPMVPVKNGEIIRALGDDLGDYEGTYYVKRVETQHLTGSMTLECEFRWE